MKSDRDRLTLDSNTLVCATSITIRLPKATDTYQAAIVIVFMLFGALKTNTILNIQSYSNKVKVCQAEKASLYEQLLLWS